ncbi:MAG TPA: type II toxin-antitoxin system VapC family toxin [Rhizomicrobium sp.]
MLVAALTTEARTTDAQAWITAQRASSIAISDWVITEFSSALAIKIRTGQIDPAERSIALAKFNQLADGAFIVLVLERADFRAAAHFSDQHKLGIRGGDALHLAISSRLGLTLSTLDEDLAAAGPVLGVKTLLL